MEALMLWTIVVPLDGTDFAALSPGRDRAGHRGVGLHTGDRHRADRRRAADWAFRLHTRLRIVTVYDPVLPEPCPISTDRGGGVMCTESMLCP